MDPNFGRTSSEHGSRTIRMPYMASDTEKDEQARKTSPAHINNPSPSRVVPDNVANDIEAGAGGTIDHDDSPVAGIDVAGVETEAEALATAPNADIECGRHTPPPVYIL